MLKKPTKTIGRLPRTHHGRRPLSELKGDENVLFERDGGVATISLNA